MHEERKASISPEQKPLSMRVAEVILFGCRILMEAETAASSDATGDIMAVILESVTRCPDEMGELKARYQAIGEPYNGNKRHWISVQLGSDVDDALLKQLVLNSYNLVKSNKK